MELVKEIHLECNNYTCVIRLFKRDYHSKMLPLKYYCGYVEVPLSHPLYFKENIELYDSSDIVHGGITFQGKLSLLRPSCMCTMDKWYIGFDCAHWGDNIEVCNEQFVNKELEKLAQFLNNNK